MVALAVSPFPQVPASASCAAPYLKVSDRLVLERGAAVMIEGRYFVDGCRDGMSCATGCAGDSCEYVDPPPKPMKDVLLRLVQGDRRWNLGVADAETAEGKQMGRVTWDVRLPAGAEPGPATLVTERAQPVHIRIR